MASFFIDGNGKRYSLGVAQVTLNNRIYVRPTAQTYLDAGLTEVTIAPRPNDNYYIVTGPDNTGAYSSTPRDLAELKSRFVEQQKETALRLLSGTDWYVIRNIEDSTEIPSAVSTFRSAIRTICSANEGLINGVANVTALASLLENPSQVQETPGDENSAFIDNTEPHLDAYPESPV